MKVEIISETRRKEHLLGQMVSIKNALGVTGAEWSRRYDYWLIQLPVTWTLVTEMDICPTWGECWKQKYGDWKHSGNGDHNNLGMAFAWFIQEEKGLILDEINLSDSPDVIAKIGNTPVMGDIGQCTPVALLQGLHALYMIHGLWISVLDYSTQVVLEFGYNPGMMITNNLGFALYGYDEQAAQEAIRDIFYCDDCEQWTVDNKTREAWIKKWATPT